MWTGLDGFIEPGSEEETLVRTIDMGRLPGHVAVIMDGNGRWARRHGLSRIEGHAEGSKSVREIIETASRLEIRFLTLYAFSKENWKRPRSEVSRLWRLLRDYLKREDKMLMEHDLRLVAIGQREGVPAPVIRELERVEELTRGNRRTTIVLALNYSGRSEIIDAVLSILKDGPSDARGVDEEFFAGRLYTAGIPDPDLLIRTSGELRVSNFLLWQIAYTEIWTTPVLWPDFRKKHFLQAVADYQKRDRRFGDVRSGRDKVAGP
jgi:undecaprenyl diphosphate synthase